MTKQKAVSINDFYKYKFISNIKLSDDAKSIVFVVKSIDEEKNCYKSNLYLHRGKKCIRLTNSGKDSNFIFDGNDNILIFANQDDEKRNSELEQYTSVYRMSLKGGEKEKIFEIPLNVSFVKIIDKNTWAILADIDKNYPDYYLLNYKEKDIVNKEYKDNKDYEEIDESPFWFNGEGFINSHRSALFLFDVKKKKLQRISNANMNVRSVSQTCDKLYYTGSEYDKLMPLGSCIRSYDLKEKTDVLLNDENYQIDDAFAFDNALYSVVCMEKEYGLNENPYICRLEDGHLDEIYYSDYSFGSSACSDVRLGGGPSFVVDNDYLYFIEMRRDKACLSCIDKNGFKYDLYDGEYSVESFDVKKGRVILCLLKGDELQELYELCDGKLFKLTDLNKESLKDKYVGIPKKLSFMSEGTDIDGWIIYPKDYDKDKQYPAILDIHGGPKTAYSDIFYHEMQYWAGKGYFVFFCNPYGSDGRGNAFADIRGEYGTRDYQNIMDFTDFVLDNYPSIDKDRVFVTGGSYGGFMTNWIVGHTNRFKAAATQRSISNWISFEGVSDIGAEFATDQNGVSFLDQLEKVFDRSPLKYVNNVKTPILFIHSDEDYRCPLEQGIQFYTAIKRKGIDSKLVIFHGENHELSRSGKPLHRVKRLDEITKWFEKHME